MTPAITQRHFGVLDNNPVTELTISNANGMQVSVINYGATITRIITPDRNGNAGNVIIGFHSLDGYIQNGNQYLGCIVGRYCNRIANASFTVDGKKYKLAKNDKGNSLHGGIKGFDKVLWNMHLQDDHSIRLWYTSVDGEEGYPGNLQVELVYTLTHDNELRIDYFGRTDKACPVNLTSHCYFNLSAGRSPSILDHELKIYAKKYTPVDNESIPTGKLANLKNTPMDFWVAKKVGKDIGSLKGGYDINLVLNDKEGRAAELYDPASGRMMEVFTTEPGLQFYSGNFLHAAITNPSSDKKYQAHAALCLEAQHYPNSPNEPSFPTTIVQPGELYRQTTVYKFSAK